jgi:cytochrome c oxidase assembly protein subunit 15
MSKKLVFEEVGETSAAKTKAPAPGAAEAKKRANRRFTARWLIALAGLVALMVMVGGLTRLTESGLSITEWNLVTGVLPPLNDAAWQAEFAKYQQIPQFGALNPDMTLAEFRTIYFWEWGHRQLGRFIFLAWLLPFLFLAATKRVPAGWGGRLFGVGVLIVVQGAIGWWMVTSGLNERISVASYRLAVHLGLAFALLGLLVWQANQLLREDWELLQARRRRLGGLTTLGGLALAVLFVQVLLGALVAGIDAGRGYIDWPLMGGEILPSESFDYEPFWTNFFENPALVQFNHRIGGYLTFFIIALFWLKSRASGLEAMKTWGSWALVAAFGQVSFGIVTVMNAAPLHWAALHQLVAVALFTVMVRARFEAAYPAQQKIARGRAPK